MNENIIFPTTKLKIMRKVRSDYNGTNKFTI